MKLKTILLCLFASFCISSVLCQNEQVLDSINKEQYENVYLEKSIVSKDASRYTDNKMRRNGGYFGVSTGITSINNTNALQNSISLMAFLNQFFGIGIEGKLIFTDQVNVDGAYEDETISYALGYTGLCIEPVILQSKPVHIVFPIFMGAGGFAYTHSLGNNSTSDSPSTAIFVFEPGMDVEYNVSNWLRIGLGASYRLINSIDDDANPYVANSNGLSYALTFKMGWF